MIEAEVVDVMHPSGDGACFTTILSGNFGMRRAKPWRIDAYTPDIQAILAKPAPDGASTADRLGHGSRRLPGFYADQVAEIAAEGDGRAWVSTAMPRAGCFLSMLRAFPNK